jgi:hypothetical protein
LLVTQAALHAFLCLARPVDLARKRKQGPQDLIVSDWSGKIEDGWLRFYPEPRCAASPSTASPAQAR